MASSLRDLIEYRGTATLGDVIDVRHARLVVIHDEWVGYNHHSPVCCTYELRRDVHGGLAGKGRLSTAVAGERVVEVKVSPAIATWFLNTLASVSVAPGAYEAQQDHTDDYPHIEIALHVDQREMGKRSGIALLFTESQGEFFAPWGGCAGGELFTVVGDDVGRALAQIRRPLKNPILERMSG